jgi:hypothetical protein
MSGQYKYQFDLNNNYSFLRNYIKIVLLIRFVTDFNYLSQIFKKW